eukprot:gene57213-76402_t
MGHWLLPDRGVRDRWPLGFAVALLSTGLCIAARVALDAIYPQDADFLLFVPALIASAAAGGLAPALLACALSLVACLGLQGGLSLAEPGALVRVGVFVGLGVISGLVGARMLKSADSARRMIVDLEAREAHLQSILATAPDAMIVIDEHGIIQSFSATARSKQKKSNTPVRRGAVSSGLPPVANITLSRNMSACTGPRGSA